MDINEIKTRVCAAIDESRADITAWGDAVLANPELGFKEYKTSALARDVFDSLGVAYEYPLAVTGVRGSIQGKPGGVNVCLIGEMDCVANTGHSCGHNAQVAVLLGAACGLVKSGVLGELAGAVTFFAVPAEEYIDIPFRKQLAERGGISYLSGKQELIASGAFDGIDMAIMLHAKGESPEPRLYLDGGNLGFVYKEICFTGREAHGSEPYKGINALSAANLALAGINANRETFRDEDGVRIHPIISNGGGAVNSVPAVAVIETYVRAKNAAAMEDAAAKVDRCARGAAAMVGAEVDISTAAGYLPLLQDAELSRIIEQNARKFIPEQNVVRGVDMTGSTDIGDLSCLIPCAQPLLGGFSGALHSADFRMTDPETAYILPAKLLATTVVDLLSGDAGKGIKNNFKPRMTREEYIGYLNKYKGE